MKRSVAVPLYVLMVFLSGVLAGAVGYRLYSAKTVTATPAPRPKPEEWRKRMVEEMRRRLNLSAEQVGALQAAYDTTRQKFDAYDQHAKEERKSIIEQQHEQIRAFLNPDQRVEYEKFLVERQKRRAEAHKK